MVLSPVQGKHISNQARRSHESLITILDSLDAAVYVADMDTYEVLFANKNLRENVGVVEGDICWRSIQQNQSSPCSFCTNAKLLTSEKGISEPYVWEFQNTVNKNWYHIIDRAIPWVDGRIVRLEIATDITERKVLEKELLEKEKKLIELNNKLEDVSHLSSTGGWELDISTMHLTWSKETYRIYEVPDTFEPNVDNALHFYTSESQPVITAAVDMALKNGTPYELELSLITAKGRPLWVRTSGKIIYKNGTHETLVGIIQNITEQRQSDEMLLLSEKNLREAQRISHIGSWHMNVSTNQVTWTEELYRMYGFDPKLPVPPYTEHQKLFTLESWESLRTSLSNTTEKGIPYELELETVKSDGSNGWMWVSGEAVTDKNGETVGLQGVAQDITERITAEKALRTNQRQINLILNTVPDIIWLKDKEGVYLNCNPMFERLFGAEKAEIIGKTDYDFVDVELADSFRQHDKAAMETDQGTINEEWLTFADDGHQILLETTKTPFKDEDGNLVGVLSIGHDITERKEAEEKNRHLAMTDSLTGLANRTQFDLRLLQNMKLANREGKSLALMMVDLDEFKPVNDKFGHPAGDALLQAVASIFIKFTRETDVVARLGGDEFAILVVHPEKEENASINAQRIIDEIKKTITIMGNEIQIGASIGIALYPKDADDQEGLLKKADLALYKAKESGRGIFTFYRPELNSKGSIS